MMKMYFSRAIMTEGAIYTSAGLTIHGRKFLKDVSCAVILNGRKGAVLW